MLKKFLLNLVVGISGILIVTGILMFSGFQLSHKTYALQGKGFLDEFSQNNILFYDPSDCIDPNNGIINVDSSFRIDDSIDAKSFWYAEGCIDNGTCVGHKYYGGIKDMDGVMRIPMVVAAANPGLLERETETDYDFGGMQYIYAENYDIQFNAYKGWMTVFTKKPGANSTRKYYWIVLPDKAYMTVAGDTYVATFENLSEPVFFIALDAHACPHQSENYCERAAADPDGIEIGKQFLGAFTITGGDYTEVANITGRLTSLHRLNGRGEVLANEAAGKKVVAGGGKSNSSGSVSSESATAQQIADKAKEIAYADDVDKTATQNDATDKFKEAASAANLDVSNDSLRFVQVAIKASGVDNGFPTGTYGHGDKDVDESKTVKYMDSSDKWEKIGALDDVKNLQPGDIVVSAVDGTDKNHVFIYLGDNKIASANQGKWYGRIDDFSSQKSEFPDYDFQVYRLSSDNCTSYSDKYPQYWQHNFADSDHENADHDWTQDKYNGGTFGANACGPTSMAMLATVATGKDIYPYDVAKFGNYVTTSPTSIDPKVGEAYGFEVIPESYSSKKDAYNKIKDYLNKGYMIHLSGEGCHDGFATRKGDGTCSDGHYIGIFSIDSNDKIWVANSAYMGNSQVDLQSVIDAIHNSVFTAIKGSGSSGKCNNGSYCSTKSESDSSVVGEAANIPYDDRMKYLFPNGVPTSENAMSTYLETIQVPIKNESGTETTTHLTVHKKLSSEIKAVFQEILAVDNFRVKSSETGAYNWRYMASGTGSLSHHSYGVAIDLNWNDNPATYTGGTYSPGGNYYSVTDEIVKIWKKHGFYWGGDWDGYYRDYMHFTYTDH